MEVLQLAESAYGPSVAFDGEDLLVFGRDAWFRVAPGREPVRHEGATGPVRAWVGDALVYWEAGKLRRLSTRCSGAKCGAGQLLLELARQPEWLAGAGERLAWIERDEGGTYRIRSLRAGRGRQIHESSERLVGLATIGNGVFFVEDSRDGWRIGAVSLDGGEPRYTALRSGRAPAGLIGRDDLFFYDGPTRSVHRLGPDFVVDERLAEKLVCSPLAVADSVICAQVGGLVAVPTSGGEARQLISGQTGHITALAANGTHVAWIGEAGEARAVVRVLDLRPTQ
ncbi:MAG TPA: hypothetical protein VLC09_20895 [Polyangiaceae bacterium]|nr:hypothetical protein [Polyangiaceae bacterium]